MTSKLVKTGDIHEKEITNVSVSLWYYENISEIESFMKNRNLFIYLFISHSSGDFPVSKISSPRLKHRKFAM
jgi:hypothetical protein